MKIAISSAGQNKESFLDKRFGRCNYFLIFNTENGEYKAINSEKPPFAVCIHFV